MPSKLESDYFIKENMSELPEYHKQEEFINRSKKLKEIQALGVKPYPHYFTPTKQAKSLAEEYESESIGNSEDASNADTPNVIVAGRLILFRAMGKNAFGHIQDETARIQVMFNRDKTIVESYDPSRSEEPLNHIKFIEKKIDLGDIIGIEGNLFRTQKRELTIFAKKVTLLCKALLPLPDKHSGLADKEIRYRKRWLDLISTPEVVDTFVTRSNIISILRSYCMEEGFLEVETPILQNIYGGANAKPFITHLNALDHQQMFLRISLEIDLKKLLVGGISKVFEIGKVFRNEGIDKTHNPEFTEVEAYAAYWDYNNMMCFVENFFERLAKELFGTTVVPFKNSNDEIINLDMKAPWTRLPMKLGIKQYANIDVDAMDIEELRKLLSEIGEEDPKLIKTASKGLMISLLFESKVEEHLIQPVHVIDHPIETTPLCKPHRDPDEANNGIVERFESYILGNEICNAYTELNDPVIQRKLFEDQVKRKESGDEEAHPLDEDFIEALCQGMPPAGGMGMGVDRIVMLFTNNISIRDVLYFPLMKPKG